MTGPVSIVGVWSALASIQPLSDPAGSWTPYAPMSDEFDGTELNSSKWSTDYTQWAGRQPGLFDASNVNVRHGSLTLLAQSGHRNSSWPVGYDNYSTSALHSVDKTLHGYFEVRSRSGSSSIAAGSAGWRSWRKRGLRCAAGFLAQRHHVLLPYPHLCTGWSPAGRVASKMWLHARPAEGHRSHARSVQG